MDNVDAFKSYVQQERTLLQIEEDILRDQDEDLTEEAKEEILVQKEQASAGLPWRVGTAYATCTRTDEEAWRIE